MHVWLEHEGSTLFSSQSSRVFLDLGILGCYTAANFSASQLEQTQDQMILYIRR